MSSDTYDVIVIGGGPGGSTAGALLAEYGHRVLLLDRETMPRYHIGESLIPYTWFTLNRLGVVDWLRESACPKKYSVQFVSITGKVSQPFYFFQTIEHECSQTWQVWRAEFDAMLLDNARKKGVEVQQGVTVRDVLMEGSRVVGVRADVKDGQKGREIRAKVVVDATGRDSLLSRKFQWKDRDADLNKIAVWSYYEGALRDPGLDEGATTVAYVPQKGWFWYIPLHSNIVSVGVVGEPGISIGTRAIPTRSSIEKRRRAPGFVITSASAGRPGQSASRASTPTTRNRSAATASVWWAMLLPSSIRCSPPACSWR